MIDRDLVEPAVLTGFVRNLPGPANLTLNRWLPDRTIGDIEVAWNTLFRTNRAAKFRAFDAETPIGQRDSFERRRVAMPPLGQKTVIGEEEYLQLERVRSGGDNTARLIEAVYNDAELNRNAILFRQELSRGDVLVDGRFTLQGENGLTIEADFGVDPSHLPTAATAWTDYAASDPLSEMRAWADVYTDDAGEAPAYALTSRTVVGHMLRNETLRNMVGNVNGAPPILTRQQLNAILDAHDLPQIVEYNTQVDVDGTATRPIPLDRMIYLPQDPATLGNTYWGITAEGLALASGQNPDLVFSELPGLVGVVMKDGDPVRTWTKVSATGMPVITDPRRLLTAKVY
ncbi:major capsid protein [Micromonospora maritima]|uniref:major capsid protein n=1 Tax=Micromonospora maritima TaxID=986711 RepID=UPI00157C9A9E|nr:major capsid protein [Micromonospora maritima]